MSDGDAAVESKPKAAERAHAFAIIQLSLAVVALSSTAIFYRLSELGPTATSFYRTSFAVPIFLVWMVIERRRSPGRASSLVVPGRWDGAVLALGAAVFAVNIVTYAWAVHLTSIANASLLSNLAPIFVSIGGFLLFRERVSRGFVVAMVTAIVGMGMLTNGKLSAAPDQIRGDVLAILSAIFFAGYLITIRRLSLHLTSATIMFWTAATATVFLFAATMASGEALAPLTPYGWATLLAMATFSYAFGQGLLIVALADLGAALSAVALLFLPAIAAILAWMLFGEAITARQAIGGLIILASIFAAKRASR